MTRAHRRGVLEIPITPGRFLQEQVLAPDGLTQDELATAMGVSRTTVSDIVNGRRITIEMALRLEAATRVSAEMWLNLQRKIDLGFFRERMRPTLDGIQPITLKRHFIDVNVKDMIEEL